MPIAETFFKNGEKRARIWVTVALLALLAGIGLIILGNCSLQSQVKLLRTQQAQDRQTAEKAQRIAIRKTAEAKEAITANTELVQEFTEQLKQSNPKIRVPQVIEVEPEETLPGKKFRSRKLVVPPSPTATPTPTPAPAPKHVSKRRARPKPTPGPWERFWKGSN